MRGTLPCNSRPRSVRASRGRAAASLDVAERPDVPPGGQLLDDRFPPGRGRSTRLVDTPLDGRPLGSSDSGCGIPSADMTDSPLLFDSSNLPKDHQAARKDAIEKMEEIVSELMKVKDQDAADVVRRAAKALKRPLLVVLPDKDGKFLHDGGVKTPPRSDKG